MKQKQTEQVLPVTVRLFKTMDSISSEPENNPANLGLAADLGPGNHAAKSSSNNDMEQSNGLYLAL